MEKKLRKKKETPEGGAAATVGTEPANEAWGAGRVRLCHTEECRKSGGGDKVAGGVLCERDT